MKSLILVAKVIVIGALALWIVPWIFFTKVEPGQIGVRRSAASGVDADDLGPGWRVRIPGLHKLTYLPSTYFFLDYTGDTAGPQEPLAIRTKDNNNVTLDVSVPVRIKPGRANEVVKAGNHSKDPDGRFRYMRLAEQTAVSVLREELANLDSVGFYKTERRLEISDKALTMLNDALGPLNLEAQAVLIRAVRFRPEYEQQLQRSSSTSRTSCSTAPARSWRPSSRSSTTTTRAPRRWPAPASRTGRSARLSSSALTRSAASTSPTRCPARPGPRWRRSPPRRARRPAPGSRRRSGWAIRRSSPTPT
ncbi:MAG: SPFH domain-containing protein [Myxococcales bacterium]|nr:SPFH domain-containing protein [Myxococcales bacterium]